MKEENEQEAISPGAVLERVVFSNRRIVLSFDGGDHTLQTKCAIYRRGRLYLRTHKSFAGEIVAQIGQSITDISDDDTRARKRVTFDNEAQLLLGTFFDRSHARRTRRTTT
ncbi:hypothetical protein T35B1_16986 [Salinisphaera shabanensis T35B1]|uniref:hypothetical protein n=1 Tax=Salinisphaera TaxID=180541 RepID=UPI0033426E37